MVPALAVTHQCALREAIERTGRASIGTGVIQRQGTDPPGYPSRKLGSHPAAVAPAHTDARPARPIFFSEFWRYPALFFPRSGGIRLRGSRPSDGLLTAPPCPVCLSGHDRQSCIADLGAVCGLVLGIILGSAQLNLRVF